MDRKPKFITVSDIQDGDHYARIAGELHSAPGQLLQRVAEDEMDRLLSKPDASTIPSAFNYKDGILRVWPAPGPGWEVWSDVSGKKVR